MRSVSAHRRVAPRDVRPAPRSPCRAGVRVQRRRQPTRAVPGGPRSSSSTAHRPRTPKSPRLRFSRSVSASLGGRSPGTGRQRSCLLRGGVLERRDLSRLRPRSRSQMSWRERRAAKRLHGRPSRSPFRHRSDRPRSGRRPGPRRPGRGQHRPGARVRLALSTSSSATRGSLLSLLAWRARSRRRAGGSRLTTTPSMETSESFAPRMARVPSRSSSRRRTAVVRHLLCG